MRGRYLLNIDGKATVDYDTLQEAAICATDDPDGEKFTIYDRVLRRQVTGAEILWASIQPRAKTNWQRVGF